MTTFHANGGKAGNYTNTNIGGTNNIIYGNTGSDVLTYTGSATTSLAMYGGLGQDTLTNGGTNVTNEIITGGTFNSKIYGGDVTGLANIYGHAGSDLIESGKGNAFLSGGASGNDTIWSGFTNAANAGNSTITGALGRDNLASWDSGTVAHRHIIYGGAGNATLDASHVTNTASSNYLFGGSGNDSIVGGTAFFNVATSTGAVDLLNPGTGTDTVIGGTGFEILGLGFSGGLTSNAAGTTTYSGVNVNLAGSNGLVGTALTAGNFGTASAIGGGWYNGIGTGYVLQTVNDKIVGVNNVNGSKYADNITLNAGTALVGDSVTTNLGNDTINLGGLSTSTGVTQQNLGNDTINGNFGGVKLFVMHNGTEGTAAGATSGDVIIGGALPGSAAVDTLDFSNVFNTSSITAASVGVTTAPYTLNAINGVFVNLSGTSNVSTQTGFNINFAGNAGEGTISGVSVIKGTNFNDYIIAAAGDTILGGSGNETILGGVGGNGHDVLQNNSTGTNTTIFDGTNSTVSNWFQVGNDAAVSAAGAQENIYGYNEFYHDQLYIKSTAVADLSTLTAQAATSATSGATFDNGTWSGTYSTTNTGTVALPSYKLLTFNVDAGAVVNGSVGATSTFVANTAAGKGDFVFDNVSTDANYGNLYWNSTGAANVVAGSMVEIAHIDMTSAINGAGGPLLTLTNGDFILVA